MAVIIISGSCATGRRAYVVKDNEEFFGSWSNLRSTHSVEVLEINPDGTVMVYTHFDTNMGWEGT
jgi:hypothetical protein